MIRKAAPETYGGRKGRSRADKAEWECGECLEGSADFETGVFITHSLMYRSAFNGDVSVRLMVEFGGLRNVKIMSSSMTKRKTRRARVGYVMYSKCII